jgi:hypothetical protein
MTDAERQRKRRERLRQAKKDSVTAERHEIEEAYQKRIDRLEKANRDLRKEVKGNEQFHAEAVAWRTRLLDDQKAEAEKLMEEIRQLKKEDRRLRAELHDWRMANLLRRPIIKEWYAILSMKHHPDRGGSDERMAVVNEGRDLLMKLLEEGRPARS